MSTSKTTGALGESMSRDAMLCARMSARPRIDAANQPPRVVQQSTRLLRGYGDVYDHADHPGSVRPSHSWMPLQVMAACSNDKEVSAALTYMANSTQHNQDFPVAGFNLDKTPNI